MKLRRNQMKLRKYQMISPKNFLFLPKKSTISSEGIGNFPGGSQILFVEKGGRLDTYGAGTG